MSRTLRNRPHWAETLVASGKDDGMDYRNRPLARSPYYNGRDGRRGDGVCEANGPKPRHGWAEVDSDAARHFYKRKASKKVRIQNRLSVNDIVADLLDEKRELEASQEIDEALLEEEWLLEDRMDDPWSDDDWRNSLGEEDFGDDKDDEYDRMMNDPFYYEVDYY